MRFVIVSDSIRACTGFGKQTRLLASALFNCGHEVIVIARRPLAAFCKAPDTEGDVTTGPVERIAEQFFEPACIESMVLQAAPDVVLLFRNARYLAKFEGSKLFKNVKTLVWYADENEAPASVGEVRMAGFPDQSVLAVSHSVAATLPSRKVAATLYHGLDFESLPRGVDRLKLRRKWSGELVTELSDNDVLLICADRNDVRKNWEGTYALFSAIQRKLPGRIVRLIQVTTRTEHEPYYDLELCGTFYGVSRNVVNVSNLYGTLTDNELYELLTMSDLRISCSGAEGFGLLSLEAAALKVPQVTVKLNALVEYLGEENAGLVDPFRLALYPKDAYYYSSKAYAIPHIERMAQRAVRLLTDELFRRNVVNESYSNARSLCDWPNLVSQLLAVVERTPMPGLQ